MDVYWKLVKAGYVNQGNYEPSGLTGVPQGGVLSPLLSNIYLHEFDEYIMSICNEYSSQKRIRGKQPKVYTDNLHQSARLRTELKKASEGDHKGLIQDLKRINRERMSIPSSIRTMETRKVYYTRYADD